MKRNFDQIAEGLSVTHLIFCNNHHTYYIYASICQEKEREREKTDCCQDNRYFHMVSINLITSN